MQKNIEDYLVAVKICEELGEEPTLSRIAFILNIKPPTAYKILKKLHKEGYIVYVDGKVILTHKGREKAKEVLQKHTVIEEFFMLFLGVDSKTSHEIAHLLEHLPYDVHRKMEEKIRDLRRESSKNVLKLSEAKAVGAYVITNIYAEDFVYSKFPILQVKRLLFVRKVFKSKIIVEVGGKLVVLPKKIADYIEVERCETQ